MGNLPQVSGWTYKILETTTQSINTTLTGTPCFSPESTWSQSSLPTLRIMRWFSQQKTITKRMCQGTSVGRCSSTGLESVESQASRSQSRSYVGGEADHLWRVPRNCVWRWFSCCIVDCMSVCKGCDETLSTAMTWSRKIHLKQLAEINSIIWKC